MTDGALHLPVLQPLRDVASVVPLAVIWGVAAGAMEAVSLPLADRSWSSFGWLLLANVSAWSVVGVAIAWLVERAQWRLERPLFLAASIAVAALALSAIASLIFSIGWIPGPALGIARVLPDASDPVASFMYQAWIVVFYGGLYVIAWRFNQRAERTRAMLDRAQIARVRSEMLFGAAQLQALREHIDPAFLLRVMEEVERRYGSAPEDADRLVNLLVAFLRMAMPGVRSGDSTLVAELALAQSYAELWSDLDRGRATWRIEAPEKPGNLPFPPLLLLRVLDRLAIASSERERGRVRVVCGNDRVTVTFDADVASGSDWLTPQLAYRMRVALSTRFGHAWSMSLRSEFETDAPALRITMGRAQNEEASRDTSLVTR